MESDTQARPRQLVLCCDGTNNTLTGGVTDTNVLKLFALLSASDDPYQRLYYDPGVGAPDALPSIGPGDWLSRRWNRLSGLASGRGVFDNIRLAYQFLADCYRPGDQIYLFGFSRGAFTVRCVAGMINLFGLVRSEHAVLMPTLLQVYFSRIGTDGTERGTASGAAPLTREAVAAQIRDSFTSVAGREAAVHFVGVWDTVASVGLPPFSLRISSNATVRGKRFSHVRQALSLDEHRWPFLPRIYSENNFGNAHSAQSLVQLWFRGVHSDVGGGYPVAESGLPAITFGWMLEQARDCGLRAPAWVPEPEQQYRMHDPLWGTALWAAAGMCVRDSRTALGTDGSAIPILPQTHPSVRQLHPDSVWHHARRWTLTAVLGLVLIALWWWLLQLLRTAGHGSLLPPLSILSSAAWLPAMAQARLPQLDQSALRAALWVAMLMLPVATALLGLPLSRGYTRAVGWRQVDMPRPWFAPLGLALPLTWAAAAVGLLLGMFALRMGSGSLQVGLMFLASVSIWCSGAGLAGCAILLLTSLKKGPHGVDDAA